MDTKSTSGGHSGVGDASEVPEAGGGSKPPLATAGGGGGELASLGVVREMIRLSEEKQVAKIEVLDAKIASKLERLDSIPTKWTIWGAAVTTGGTVLAIVLAILALGGDRFDGGMGLGASIGEKFSENKLEIERLKKENATANQQILDSLNQLNKRLDGDAQRK